MICLRLRTSGSDIFQRAFTSFQREGEKLAIKTFDHREGVFFPNKISGIL
jgi:hypothetical protein